MHRILPILLVALLATSALACPKPQTSAPPPSSENGDVNGQDDQAASSTAQTEPLPPPDPTVGLERGKPEIGKEYFYGENRGRCLKCHALGDQGEPTGYALDDVGLRRNSEWLAIFIDNPRNARPEVARMPPFRGDVEGATIADVVAFLMTLMTPVDHPESTDVKPPDEPDRWGGSAPPQPGPHPDY